MYAPWVAPFLTALGQLGVVARAARAAGISSTAAYALKRTDADFAAAWDYAMEDAMDDIETAARERALGFEELVVYQGQLTPVFERGLDGRVILDEDNNPVQARLADGSLRWLTITKHSDAMAALLLKGRRKKVFADRTELTGADGAPIATTDATARRARIASIYDAAKARVGLA